MATIATVAHLEQIAQLLGVEPHEILELGKRNTVALDALDRAVQAPVGGDRRSESFKAHNVQPDRNTVALDALDRAAQAPVGHPPAIVNNVDDKRERPRGNSADAALRRLRAGWQVLGEV